MAKNKMIIIEIIGASNNKVNVILVADEIGMSKSYYEINGKSMRENLDDLGYGDFAIKKFYIYDNVILKDFTK